MLRELGKHELRTTHYLSRVFDAVPAQLSRSIDGGSSRFTFKDVMPNSRRFKDLAGLSFLVIHSRDCTTMAIHKQGGNDTVGEGMGMFSISG